MMDRLFFTQFFSQAPRWKMMLRLRVNWMQTNRKCIKQEERFERAQWDDRIKNRLFPVKHYNWRHGGWRLPFFILSANGGGD
jgi:hypothetical protein